MCSAELRPGWQLRLQHWEGRHGHQAQKLSVPQVTKNTYTGHSWVKFSMKLCFILAYTNV